MSQTSRLNFIVIDDSKLDCFIAEKIIKNTGQSDSVKSFLQAKEALEFIRTFPHENDYRTIVLVDIQMPIMNGFEFVEAFEALPADTRAHYTLYVISSSINDNDLNRVNTYSSVKQFVNKPLTSNSLMMMLE